MNRRTQLVALAVVFAVGSALPTGAPGALATGQTVTVGYVAGVGGQGSYTVTPSSVSIEVGGTVILANTLTSGNNDEDFYIALVNGTGSVQLGVQNCTGASLCQVRDLFNGSAMAPFTVTALGTVTVARVYGGGAPTTLDTITLTEPDTTPTITITESGRGRKGSTDQAPESRKKKRHRWVFAKGTSTGLDPGTELKAWVKFPGQTVYRAQETKITVDSKGNWSWSRKASKKTYLYMTTSDEVVRSSRVIIPAK